MRRFVLRLITLALSLSVLAASTAGAGDKTSRVELKPGDIPPKALGFTRNNDEIETTQFAGRVMVVTFWASWCGPCRQELTMLEKLQTLAQDRLKIVAVNIEDRDMFRKITRTLGDMKVTLTSDPSKRSASAYGVGGIPHMVIIGRDGKIAKVHTGYGDQQIEGLLEEISAELAKG